MADASHPQPGVESLVLWHDGSKAETGGCYAPVGRRAGERFARTARSAGTTGAYPFDAAAVGCSRPHHAVCGGWRGCARECPATRGVAEDSPPMAQAVAAGGRRGVRARAFGRRAAARSAWDVYPGADLRDRCDDMREASGERSADQPLERTRACGRSAA